MPAGTDVYVVKWHEALPGGGWVDGAKGAKVTLKTGPVNDLGETKIKK